MILYRGDLRIWRYGERVGTVKLDGLCQATQVLFEKTNENKKLKSLRFVMKIMNLIIVAGVLQEAGDAYSRACT